MHFFKIILDICLLRGRAQDLPASMNLVWLTAVVSVAVNALGMPEPDLDLAQWLFIASQAVLFGAAVWLLLRLRGFPARWMQTVTALYAVDAVFSLLLLPFLPALMEMIKQGPETKPGWEAYLLLALSGWLLLDYRAHIARGHRVAAAARLSGGFRHAPGGAHPRPPAGAAVRAHGVGLN